MFSLVNLNPKSVLLFSEKPKTKFKPLTLEVMKLYFVFSIFSTLFQSRPKIVCGKNFGIVFELMMKVLQ